MEMDLYIPEAWENINDILKVQFQIPADQTIKVYKGFGHALFETSVGISHFYSHKRSIALVKGTSPFFEFLLPTYQKDAYQIQAVDQVEFAGQGKSWTEWVEGLKKDTVLVLASEDHPITGEIYDLSDLDRALNEKKIFFIRLSHFRHFYEKVELNPFTIRVCSYGPNLSLVLGGPRYRVPSLFSAALSWNWPTIQRDLNPEISPLMSAPAREQIEKELADQCFFKQPSPRLNDRSLFVFSGVSGERMIQGLLSRTGGSPGGVNDSRLWSTHLCLWNSFKLLKNWWTHAPPPEVLRDLVVFGSEWLTKPGFSNMVKSLHQELKDQQSWKL